ncbi:alpha/beta hydrolase family protein [Streptomyces sp. NPDC102264]|uniref:alpha/beta hydrolase family protein n=1 Tax=Streptomyces sp. NPDC102264 TaxID=3366149 RepID=UPI0037FAEC1F
MDVRPRAVDVRPGPRTAAVPGATGDGEVDTVEIRPDLTAYAVLSAPALPSVSDYNPATVHWRNLSVDPDLTGLAPSRSRHARIALGRDGDPRLWALPLRTLPAAGLAWHPRLPLIAGLVQRGREVHPWTADYAARRVTIHERVRAALSLTPHGGGRRCLAWCGDGELALLTPPPPPPSPAPPAQPPQGPSPGPAEVRGPVVCEASGPGHVVFLPGLAELAGLAAATVSVLNPATGGLRVLAAPAPLLIGGLEPSPTGRRLLVDHVVGTDDSVRQTDDTLRWSRAVVRTDLAVSDGWSEVPRTARWSGNGGGGDTIAVALPGGVGIGASPQDGTVQEGTVQDGTVIDLRSPRPRPLPPDRPPARLTVSHEPGDAAQWWRCLASDDEPLVISRHCHGLRLTTRHTTHLVPLPPEILRPGGRTRLGPWAAVYDRIDGGDGTDGIVLEYAAEGRAGLLIVDRERRTARVVPVPPVREEDDGSPIRCWATVQDGQPQLTVQQGSRLGLRRYALRGDRLEPVGGPWPLPVRHARRVRPVSTPGTTLFPVSEPDGPRLLPVTPGVDGPQLLWIHARGYGSSPTSAYSHPSLSGTDAPTAVLDLPLRWPADARPADLHRQITGAVDTATHALREKLGRTGPVVVGGHSFAATLALYALAHRPGLAGAIAHSGSYNRTLTPDGFQYERRTYWQAPDVYRAFSALDFAGRLDRPVLLVHGCEDTNPATPPDQAVALYRAVVATGGHARLLLLPYEGHTFRHRESLDAVAREHGAWLLARSGPSSRTHSRSPGRSHTHSHSPGPGPGRDSTADTSERT